MYNSSCNRKTKVSSLIKDGTWFVSKIPKRNALDIAKLIESTEINSSPEEIIWAPVAKGEFNLAGTYEFVRRTNEP